MFDSKALSKAIRDKKNGALRPDMDYAGQNAVDPNAAIDEKMATEVNEALGEPDHAPASKAAMGENESSQENGALKKSQIRVRRYFEGL